VYEIEVDGVKRSCLTIGAVAHAISRSIHTVRVWEREVLLPKTPYRTSNGQRLYTIEQMQELREKAKRDPRYMQKMFRRRRSNEVTCRVRWADGREEAIVLYRVRILAQEIKRTVQTIRLMEKRNGLPVTPFRSGTHRLYTLEMIEAVKHAFVGRKYGSNWSDIYIQVLHEWQKQGVLGAKVLEDGDESAGSGSGDVRQGSEEGDRDASDRASS
jgi:DNA-binding transcriptional MerR regulator